MIDEATIQSAKDVDINKILDNFNWERGHDNMMHCPSPQHVDSTPSCSYNAKIIQSDALGVARPLIP